MLASITHILPLTTIVRKRTLPADGRVIARIGQSVEPAEVVADTVIGRKHLIVDLAQILRVPPRQATGFIKVKKGQKVSQGETIAESTGLFGREVSSPADGRIAAVGSGKIILEMGGKPFELTAGYPGVVTEIIPGRGVAIRATGSLLQGVWGNGRFETGVMMSVMDRADEPFDPSRLDISLRGAIILGGYTDNPAVFTTASELAVRGLILSSMAPTLLTQAAKLDYPVMLVDGFGQRPMNSSAYKLLSTNDRRIIALNASAYDRLGGNRPEIFIPLPVSQEPPVPRDVETFRSGQTVQVISLTRPSRIGTLVNISPNQVNLPNGLKVKTAEVQLESGEQIFVPLTNLEVLG